MEMTHDLQNSLFLFAMMQWSIESSLTLEPALYKLFVVCDLSPGIWIDDTGQLFSLELVPVLPVLDELLLFPREKVWSTSVLIWL